CSISGPSTNNKRGLIPKPPSLSRGEDPPLTVSAPGYIAANLYSNKPDCSPAGTKILIVHISSLAVSSPLTPSSFRTFIKPAVVSSSHQHPVLQLPNQSEPPLNPTNSIVEGSIGCWLYLLTAFLIST